MTAVMGETVGRGTSCVKDGCVVRNVEVGRVELDSTDVVDMAGSTVTQ